jgi:hypothetical protein
MFLRWLDSLECPSGGPTARPANVLRYGRAAAYSAKQKGASQMKSARRSTVISLALSMVTTSQWLGPRDVDETSASGTAAVRYWRTFAISACEAA